MELADGNVCFFIFRSLRFFPSALSLPLSYEAAAAAAAASSYRRLINEQRGEPLEALTEIRYSVQAACVRKAVTSSSVRVALRVRFERILFIFVDE